MKAPGAVAGQRSDEAGRLREQHTGHAVPTSAPLPMGTP